MGKKTSGNSIDTANLSFPRTDIPKRQKDEEYHKQFNVSISNQGIDSNYDVNYEAMTESVAFFDGSQSAEAFRFLQEAEDGEVLPAVWQNYNRVRVRLETVFGEFMSKGYKINASSINKDAKARKLSARQQSIVDMNLTPARKGLEDASGLDLAPQRPVFETEQQVDDYYKYTFKERNEVVMERSLRWLASKHKWLYNRLATYRDLRIMGRCFYETVIADGLPYAKRIDPRFVIVDPTATDDFFSDAGYWMVIKYMTLADAASHYGLSEDEITEVYGRWQEFKGARSANLQLGFSGLDNTTIDYFRKEGNDLRVLVQKAYWLDQEVLTHRETVDNNGGEHIKQVSDEAKSGKLRRNTIAQWRTSTLIGGEILRDWGILENSVRENEALADTSCPIKGLAPHYLNGRSVSLVQQMKELQNFKNVTLYNLQLEMSTAGRKGFMYDVSQTPDGMTPEQVRKHLKTAGIAYFDSMASGLPATHNQFSKIDQTLSSAVEQYIRISQMIDMEMDAITGVNYARQGQSTGANQGLGVTQTALMQSAMSTRTVDDLFMMLNEQVLNALAGLVKLSIADNDRYAAIIGDADVEFMEDTMDLELDDFGVFMEEVPPILDDLQSFRGLVETALSSGQINFVDATRLLIEKDIEIGIERLERAIEKRQEEAMQQQQMQMEQQQMATQQAQAQLAQQQLQQSQMDQQGKENLERIKGDYKIQDRNIDGRQNIDEIVTEGKVAANQSRQDFVEESSLQKTQIASDLKKLKDNSEARRETAKAASDVK
jgi:hypothetical protein